jgi:anthranilate phosphoribosyltransferase
LDRIVGSTPEENVALFRKLLESKGDDKDEKLNAVIDFVAMNAGAAIYVFGLAKDLKEGTKIAKETIFSGKAKKLVEEYVKATREIQ